MSESELDKEIRIIRAAYPWLDEATIERYAEQVIKKRHGDNKD